MTHLEALTLLGVGYDASHQEIRRAWRKLALIHHPDRGGDHGFFVHLSEAYQFLMNDLHTPNNNRLQLPGSTVRINNVRRRKQPVADWYWDEQQWLEREFGHLGYWNRKGRRR